MDKKKIKVTLVYEDKKVCEKTVEFATPVTDIIDGFGLPVENIYAVKINNEVRPLDTPIQFTSNIEPILNNTKDGSNVYRRSLCLLLAAASHNLFPEKRLIVGHSLGHGYFYTYDNEKSVHIDVINKLNKEMTRLIKDAPRGRTAPMPDCGRWRGKIRPGLCQRPCRPCAAAVRR